MDRAWMIHPFLSGVAPVGQRPVADHAGADALPVQDRTEMTPSM